MAEKPYGKIDLSHAVWRRSSTGNSDRAVEVAFVGDVIAVRDSTEGDKGEVLLFTREEWEAFKAGVNLDEFNPENLNPPQI